MEKQEGLKVSPVTYTIQASLKACIITLSPPLYQLRKLRQP